MNDNHIFIDQYLESCKSISSTITPTAIINLISHYMNNFIYVQQLKNKKLKYKHNRNPFGEQLVIINGRPIRYLFIIYAIKYKNKKYLKFAIQFESLLWNNFP